MWGDYPTARSPSIRDQRQSAATQLGQKPVLPVAMPSCVDRGYGQQGGLEVPVGGIRDQPIKYNISDLPCAHSTRRAWRRPRLFAKKAHIVRDTFDISNAKCTVRNVTLAVC
jgi:hypothetical protein